MFLFYGFKITLYYLSIYLESLGTINQCEPPGAECYVLYIVGLYSGSLREAFSRVVHLPQEEQKQESHGVLFIV